MNKTEKEIIDKFYQETWYELTVKDGKFYCNGNLDLFGNNITYLPDDLTVNGFLELSDSSIKELPNNLIVHGFFILVSYLCHKITRKLNR